MIPELFFTIRMDVTKKGVISQFSSVIPVNATYSAIHWFAEVNAMMLPLCHIVVPLFDRLVWWNDT